MTIVETYTHDHDYVRHDVFFLCVPIGSPLLAEVARAVGLPDGFEHSWWFGSPYIYPESEYAGEQTEEES